MANTCKYCKVELIEIVREGLQCYICEQFVHLTCLKRGSTPGGMRGDVFLTFTCLECSETNMEIFVRENIKWFHVILLTVYNLLIQNKAISKNGFFHWKMHIATFIDKNWEILFGRTVKQKKNWMGTISGNLSIYNNLYFQKSTVGSGEGLWSLMYPKLTPFVIANLASELLAKKCELRVQQISKSDRELLDELLQARNFDQQYLTTECCNEIEISVASGQFISESNTQVRPSQKRQLHSTIETSGNQFDFVGETERKRQRIENISQEDSSSSFDSSNSSKSNEIVKDTSTIEFRDPMCHYNTSLNDLTALKRVDLKIKLMGGLREEPILSPYSNLYLKPYIYQDGKNISSWLKLMAQMQLKANRNIPNYSLPSRWPITYVYIQPSHIPAINSLCARFFWPGIDLTDSLQYPDFTCVAMYKKLIVGFAVIVPDVKVHENYISFLFVRPGWRNIGIAKFMIYHLIQASMGKDITLHVSINNPALFLYQQFGFKVEHVDMNFYEKYLCDDRDESKHAFFCRLER